MTSIKTCEICNLPITQCVTNHTYLYCGCTDECQGHDEQRAITVVQPLTVIDLNAIKMNTPKLITNSGPVWREQDLSEVILMGEIVQSHSDKKAIEVKYDKQSGIPSMVKFRLHHRDNVSTVVLFSSTDNGMMTQEFIKKAQAGDFVTVWGYYDINEVEYNGQPSRFVQVVATSFKMGATRTPKTNIKISGEIVSKPNYFENKAGQPQLFVTLSNYSSTGRTAKTNNVQLVAFGDVARKLFREIVWQSRLAANLNYRINQNIEMVIKDKDGNIVETLTDKEKGRAKPHFTIIGDITSSTYTDGETGKKVYSNQVSVVEFTANPNHDLIRTGRLATGTQGGLNASSVTIEGRYTETVKYEQRDVPSGFTANGKVLTEKKLVRKSIWTTDDLDTEVDGTHAPTLSDFASIERRLNNPSPQMELTMNQLIQVADAFLMANNEFDLMLTPIKELRDLQEKLNRDLEAEADYEGDAIYDIDDFESYITTQGDYTEEEIALFDRMQDEWMGIQAEREGNEGYAF